MNKFLEKIKSDLNPEQLKAVVYTDGPLLILAGAGSGKTRVLTYKAAYLVHEKNIPPYRILAVTFTNKAANEMKTRLIDLAGPSADQMRVSTFHSFCLRVLRRYADRIGYEKSFGVYDQDDSLNLIKRCMESLDISVKTHAPRAVAEYISRAKEIMVDPEEYEKTAAAYFNKIVSKVYKVYQQQLRKSNVFDFDDLLFWTVYILQNHEDVREKLQNHFQHVLVDEYQDTNHVQFLLVKILAEKSRMLTVVGDDDQSIYGWRGADIRNILDFEASFPDCRIIKLEQNYRSTKMILRTASEVVKYNRSRKGKTLWTEGEEGELIKLIKVNSDRNEAEMICEDIENMVASDKYKRRDIAILYRTNAQSRALEESLKNRFIPYTIVGGIRFYQRKEIKDILAYLKMLVNPYDIISFRRIINFPKRGIGPVNIARIEQAAVRRSTSPLELLLNAEELDFLKGAALNGAKQFQRIYKELVRAKKEQSPVELAETAARISGIVDSLSEYDQIEAESRKENIDELIAAVQEYCDKVENATLEGFLEEIALYTDVDTWDSSQDVVTLMTLHSAKGLEFPKVFITGLEEGLFPLSRSMEKPEELEEERRLFYVGITRAEKSLTLSYAQRRMRFGEMLSIKSRFIDELPEECIEFEDQTFSSSYPGTYTGSERAHYDEQNYVAPNDKYRDLKVGKRIIHPTWGEGKIVSRTGSSDNTTVEVRFRWGGKKKLFAKYANLKLI
ncbi:MAG TPA: ATP-dependent DNA helicase PcrA [candidate division Zixibacteria bacterium]|nr:ATP-dependent DNA helicase PcrA [candidate division Zixibacteria bacterium]HEQ99340.1 ATP-dependent DNA helicase PcrA [candidate division Zixibacteria bacterium]